MCVGRVAIQQQAGRKHGRCKLHQLLRRRDVRQEGRQMRCRIGRDGVVGSRRSDEVERGVGGSVRNMRACASQKGSEVGCGKQHSTTLSAPPRLVRPPHDALFQAPMASLCRHGAGRRERDDVDGRQPLIRIVRRRFSQHGQKGPFGFLFSVRPGRQLAGHDDHARERSLRKSGRVALVQPQG